MDDFMMDARAAIESRAAPQHGAGFSSVCVIGLGYIGLPSATLFAQGGLRVFGCDIDPHILRETNAGRAHIVEPGLEAILKSVSARGLLTAGPTPAEADAYTIAVPTPVRRDGAHQPDMSYVMAAARSIAPVLRRGALVALESTSPVGSTREVLKEIKALRPDLHISEDESSEIDFCYSPERVIPGRTMEELRRNARVVGGVTPRAARRARDLFAHFAEGKILLTDDRTAEAVKLIENASRDVAIAFANELSIMCDKLGIDVFEAIAIANHHPRVKILTPGPGVGGHCIAVDPWFLIAAAPAETPLMRMARAINDGKPEIAVRKAEAALLAAGPGAKLACLGLAYKADVDDFRESPALEVALLLSARHPGRVVVHDPFAEALKRRHPEIAEQLTFVDGETAKSANAAILLVGHKAYADLHPRANLVDMIGLTRKFVF